MVILGLTKKMGQRSSSSNKQREEMVVMVTIIMIIDSQLKVLKFTSLFFRSLERAE